MPKTLSVVLITLNEAANLPRTLASVSWAQEIVVVDSGSTDATHRNCQKPRRARHSRSRGRASPRRKTPPSTTPPASGFSRSTPTKKSAPSWPAKSNRFCDGEPPFSAYRIPAAQSFPGQAAAPRRLLARSQAAPLSQRSGAFAERPVHETMEADGPIGTLRTR